MAIFSCDLCYVNRQLTTGLGAPQAGIAGKADIGAYSIIVKGGSEYADKDTGDTLWYSDATANKTDAEISGTNAGQLCLQMSYKTGRPVRVIRSSNGNSNGEHWKGAPRAGLRYDGLYTVQDEKKIPRQRARGEYSSFLLVREPNQPPIEVNKPSIKEAQEYEKIHLPPQ